MLAFLWGMLAGYIVASFEVARFIYKKGYMSMHEIPDND